MSGLSDAYKDLLAWTNEILTASVDLLNGTRDVDAEMAELERRIGAIRADDTRWGVQANLEEMRGQLADLKNERFWEGFNAGLEDVGATSERVAEEVPAAWETAGFESVEAFDKEMKRLSEVAAREAEEAADAAVAAFWARAEVESSAMARDSALGLKRSDVQAAIQAAGMDLGGDFAAAFNAGMIQGVGATSVLPPEFHASLVSAADHSGLEAGAALTKGMSGDEAASAWDRSGGFTGLFTGMTGAVSAFASGGWKGGMLSLANTAMQYLPPGMSQVGQDAIAAFGAVWNAIKRPSEEEIAARKSFAGIHASAVEMFGETAAYSSHVNELVAEGGTARSPRPWRGSSRRRGEAGVIARRGRRAYTPVPDRGTGREHRARREHRGDL